MRALVFYCAVLRRLAVAHQKMIYATPAATLWIRSSVPLAQLNSADQALNQQSTFQLLP